MKQDQTKSGQASGRGMPVLIADDDPIARAAVDGACRSWGYGTVVVNSGAQACELLLGDNPPPLAVLDWQMPDLSGPAICRRLRAEKSRPFCYILILTSRSGSADASEALDAGADDFISKPVMLQELRSRIRVGQRAVDYESRLADTNAELNAYAARMETLAEHRARQLVHAERLALLGTLAAGLTHEVANPLSYIAGNSGSLQQFWVEIEPCVRECLRQGLGDEERLEYLLKETPKSFKSIQMGVERIACLVRGLKNFARKDAADMPLCSISDCIDDALELTRSRLRYHVRVETDLPSDLPLIPCNGQQVEQVLVNLFINAADALEQADGGLMRVACAIEDGILRITVEDEGTGVPDDQWPAIWEPFYTTKSAERGTGLGLSISRGIVEEMRGAIRGENRAEGGARFIVELPVS